MSYQKPWLTYEEQLEKLKQRGMIITDEAAAVNYLERIGYYRLSAYWFPFREFSLSQDAVTQKGRSSIEKPTNLQPTQPLSMPLSFTFSIKNSEYSSWMHLNASKWLCVLIYPTC